MCGRYSIYESMDHYLRQLSLDLVVINGYDHAPINRFNVAPSTRVEIIRPVDDGLSVDRVKWGGSPFWAKGKRPDPINARAETVLTGKFFKELWPGGRALRRRTAGSSGYQTQRIRSASSRTTSQATTAPRSISLRLQKCTRTPSQTSAMDL